MTRGNQNKTELLGEQFSAAYHRLRKSLLYALADKTGMLDCYRCGSRIVSIDEFSIEHKVPWQSAQDPRAVFFDLGNIAFSHSRCNRPDRPGPRRTYSDSELLDLLRQAPRNGTAPNKWTFSGPDVRTYRKRFGSWNSAVIAAGLTPNKTGRKKRGILPTTLGGDAHGYML